MGSLHALLQGLVTPEFLGFDEMAALHGPKLGYDCFTHYRVGLIPERCER